MNEKESVASTVRAVKTKLIVEYGVFSRSDAAFRGSLVATLGWLAEKNNGLEAIVIATGLGLALMGTEKAVEYVFEKKALSKLSNREIGTRYINEVVLPSRKKHIK